MERRRARPQERITEEHEAGEGALCGEVRHAPAQRGPIGAAEKVRSEAPEARGGLDPHEHMCTQPIAHVNVAVGQSLSHVPADLALT